MSALEQFPYCDRNPAFAWSQSDQVPFLLGQFNFFEVFDVSFSRSRKTFEVRYPGTSQKP